MKPWLIRQRRAATAGSWPTIAVLTREASRPAQLQGAVQSVCVPPRALPQWQNAHGSVVGLQPAQKLAAVHPLPVVAESAVGSPPPAPRPGPVLSEPPCGGLPRPPRLESPPEPIGPTVTTTPPVEAGAGRCPGVGAVWPFPIGF